MTQNAGSLELGEKPKESALLPKPWMETTTEILSPIIWLGKLTRAQAHFLGLALWFLPVIFLIWIHWNEPDQVIGAVALTWIAAALYASFLNRVNFDIKGGT